MNAAADNQPGRFRTTVERASLPLVVRLNAMPRLVPFVLMLVLVVFGLFLGGPAGFVVVVVAMSIPAWMLYLGWPQLGQAERLMRLAVLFFVLGLAAVTLLPN